MAGLLGRSHEDGRFQSIKRLPEGVVNLHIVCEDLVFFLATVTAKKSATSLTRKLCYSKDDRAMRAI